ncbi:MAG TPA: OsmC family protein [Gemmatimonadaceae bacterium]|nr:OsmC family protein [Gemmatimonadaceae bacterium]
MAQTNGLEIRVGESGFRAEIHVGGHTLIADEPVAFGGTDEGPTPYDYLAAALGSCTAMTLRVYADRRGWPLEGVTVRMRHGRVHEKDCEDCATLPVGIHQLEREVKLEGPLTDEQREGLLRIADRCPVAQSLAKGIRVVPARPADAGDVAPPAA